MAFKEAVINKIEFDNDNASAVVTFTITDDTLGDQEIIAGLGSSPFKDLTTDTEIIAAVEAVVDDIIPDYHARMVAENEEKTKAKNIKELNSTKKFDKLKVK